jgi:hypothetical protein
LARRMFTNLTVNEKTNCLPLSVAQHKCKAVLQREVVSSRKFGNVGTVEIAVANNFIIRRGCKMPFFLNFLLQKLVSRQLIEMIFTMARDEDDDDADNHYSLNFLIETSLMVNKIESNNRLYQPLEKIVLYENCSVVANQMPIKGNADMYNTVAIVKYCTNAMKDMEVYSWDNTLASKLRCTGQMSNGSQHKDTEVAGRVLRETTGLVLSSTQESQLNCGIQRWNDTQIKPQFLHHLPEKLPVVATQYAGRFPISGIQGIGLEGNLFVYEGLKQKFYAVSLQIHDKRKRCYRNKLSKSTDSEFVQNFQNAETRALILKDLCQRKQLHVEKMKRFSASTSGLMLQTPKGPGSTLATIMFALYSAKTYSGLTMWEQLKGDVLGGPSACNVAMELIMKFSPYELTDEAVDITNVSTRLLKQWKHHDHTKTNNVLKSLWLENVDEWIGRVKVRDRELFEELKKIACKFCTRIYILTTDFMKVRGRQIQHTPHLRHLATTQRCWMNCQETTVMSVQSKLSALRPMQVTNTVTSEFDPEQATNSADPVLNILQQWWHDRSEQLSDLAHNWQRILFSKPTMPNELLWTPQPCPDNTICSRCESQQPALIAWLSPTRSIQTVQKICAKLCPMGTHSIVFNERSDVESTFELLKNGRLLTRQCDPKHLEKLRRTTAKKEQFVQLCACSTVFVIIGLETFNRMCDLSEMNEEMTSLATVPGALSPRHESWQTIFMESTCSKDDTPVPSDEDVVDFRSIVRLLRRPRSLKKKAWFVTTVLDDCHTLWQPSASNRKKRTPNLHGKNRTSRIWLKNGGSVDCTLTFPPATKYLKSLFMGCNTDFTLLLSSTPCFNIRAYLTILTLLDVRNSEGCAVVDLCERSSMCATQNKILHKEMHSVNSVVEIAGAQTEPNSFSSCSRQLRYQLALLPPHNNTAKNILLGSEFTKSVRAWTENIHDTQKVVRLENVDVWMEMLLSSFIMRVTADERLYPQTSEALFKPTILSIVWSCREKHNVPTTTLTLEPFVADSVESHIRYTIRTTTTNLDVKIDHQSSCTTASFFGSLGDNFSTTPTSQTWSTETKSLESVFNKKNRITNQHRLDCGTDVVMETLIACKSLPPNEVCAVFQMINMNAMQVLMMCSAWSSLSIQNQNILFFVIGLLVVTTPESNKRRKIVIQDTNTSLDSLVSVINFVHIPNLPNLSCVYLRGNRATVRNIRKSFHAVGNNTILVVPRRMHETTTVPDCTDFVSIISEKEFHVSNSNSLEDHVENVWKIIECSVRSTETELNLHKCNKRIHYITRNSKIVQEPFPLTFTSNIVYSMIESAHVYMDQINMSMELEKSLSKHCLFTGMNNEFLDTKRRVIVSDRDGVPRNIPNHTLLHTLLGIGTGSQVNEYRNTHETRPVGGELNEFEEFLSNHFVRWLKLTHRAPHTTLQTHKLYSQQAWRIATLSHLQNVFLTNTTAEWMQVPLNRSNLKRKKS